MTDKQVANKETQEFRDALAHHAVYEPLEVGKVYKFNSSTEPGAYNKLEREATKDDIEAAYKLLNIVLDKY